MRMGLPIGQPLVFGAITYQPIATINTNTTIYVTTAGSDSTGTGSVSTPFATIAYAMSYLQNFNITANAAVTISVGSGTFNQTAALNLYHPCGSQISITGTSSAGTPQTITSANTTTLSWNGVATNGINLNNCSFGNISNLYVVGGSSGSNNANYGIVMNSSSLNSFSMVLAQYWADGIYSYSSCITTATNLACMNNTSFGILLQYGGAGSMSNVYLSANAYGAYVYGGGMLGLTNSTMTSNTSFGLYANNGATAVCTSCAFTSNSAYGIVSSYGSTVGCSSCTFTSNTSNCIISNYGGQCVSISGTYTSNGASNAPSPAWGVVGNANAYNINT